MNLKMASRSRAARTVVLLLLLACTGRSMRSAMTIPRFYVLRRDLMGEAANAFGPGIKSFSVQAANDNDHVFGRYIRADGQNRPFVYAGAWTDLANVAEDLNRLGALDWSGWLLQPADMNDFGDLVGYYSTRDEVRPFQYSGSIHDLGSPLDQPFPSQLFFNFLRIPNYTVDAVFSGPGFAVQVGTTTVTYNAWYKSGPAKIWYACFPPAAMNEVTGDILADSGKGYALYALSAGPPLNPQAVAGPSGAMPVMLTRGWDILWNTGDYTGLGGPIAKLPDQLLVQYRSDDFARRSRERNGLILTHRDGSTILWRPRDNDVIYESVTPLDFYDPRGKYVGVGDPVDINSKGDLFTSMAVWSPSPPVLTGPVNPFVGHYGDSGTIELPVRGALGANWYRDGVLYAQGSKLTGTLSPANAPATYTLEATNVTGVLRVPFRIEIYAAPSLVSPPRDIEVCESSDAQFAVSGAGTPAPGYQWLFKGNPIPGATGPTLLITNAGLASVGEYSVRVMNSEGTNTSPAAKLALLAAPRITTAPTNQAVSAGQRLAFAVRASGSAPLSYEWLRNGQTIPGATGADFEIPSAGKSDAGEYQVVVRSSCGVDRSAAFSLEVLPPPPQLSNPRMFMAFDLVGEVGRTYQVQSKPEADASQWTTLRRLTLTGSPSLFIDETSAQGRTRIYRAILEP